MGSDVDIHNTRHINLRLAVHSYNKGYNKCILERFLQRTIMKLSAIHVDNSTFESDCSMTINVYTAIGAS